MYITHDLFEHHESPATSESRVSKPPRPKTLPELPSDILGKRKRSSAARPDEPQSKRPSTITIHNINRAGQGAAPPPTRKLLCPRASRRRALTEATPAATNWNKLPPKLTSSPSILRPCHICHKAPKQKTDLDAYTNCRRCHERTCYICMRQCEGPCGGAMVCSSCCVETGEDGVVQCLECLWDEERDHDMAD